MANYAKHFSAKSTPQTQPIPGKAMVANSGGGYSFKTGDWDRLTRFLILGSAGGTYYIGEKKLTLENAECVLRCLNADGLRVVKEIVDISDAGRAPKNDPALFALALASAYGDAVTKKAAFDAIPKVARIGTHLFMYAQFVNSMRGWGSGLRKGVARWYDRPVEKLAYDFIKYPQRITEEGNALSRWSHRDLLRLVHPVGSTEAHKDLFDYACHGCAKIPAKAPEGLDIIIGVEKMKTVTKASEAIALIEQYKLPHEVIPKELANHADVWRALLPNMPLTATMRTLGRLTNYGVIAPGSQEAKDIVKKMTDVDYVKKSRMHPLNVLVALKTYAQGRGTMGDLTWSPNSKIADALDEMFYLSFGNVEPTGKSLLMGLDVSGSMASPCAGIPSVSCAEACAVLSMVTARVEKDYEVMAFNNGIQHIDISPKMRLDAVMKKASNINCGGTDCSLPMIYASKNKMKVDAFMVLTDSDTYAGQGHPCQELEKYRKSYVKDAKLIVVGMTSNGFTIADPDDANSLDVVGFDTATPGVISAFIRGTL